MKQNQRPLRLALALLFLFMVCFIHFAHTHCATCGDEDCPSCQLQFTVNGVAPVIFLLLVLLIGQIFFGSAPKPEYESQFEPEISSRAPPEI